MSEPTRAFELSSEGFNSPALSVHLRFMARVGTDLPHGVSVHSPAQVVPRQLVPDGSVIKATWQSFDGFEVLAEAEGFAIHVDVGSWGTIGRVAGATIQITEELTAWLRDALDSATHDRVEAYIWNASSKGGSFKKRSLSIESWEDIETNYPLQVRASLHSLMQVQSPGLEEGRLILLYGEPGTGKTNAIRALMAQWSPWCDIHLVTDPDRLFADAHYLLNVMQKSAETVHAPTLTSISDHNRWNLVIAEDAGAHLIADGTNGVGVALGRFLNATDGLLAQASRLLILLTTNTAIRDLHPAVVRPGRCLTKIEFTRFSALEARSWLGEAAPDFGRSATLAELYKLRLTGEHPKADVKVGSYL